MIGQIRGTLIARQAPEILVDVGGIGYEIQVPMTTLYQLPELGQPVTLLTHFVVREDAQQLFGFAESHDFKRQADIAANAAPRVKACGLKHIAIGARLARGAWRHAIDGDVAASRLFEIRHYPQKCGFAAA